jgi:hypothetical protein
MTACVSDPHSLNPDSKAGILLIPDADTEPGFIDRKNSVEEIIMFFIS